MGPLFRRLFQLLGQWPIALATCGVLAALVLLPALGAAGLWEPQERQLADRVAPPDAVEAVKPTPPDQPEPADGCWRTAPRDALARSLTPRAIEFGRDYLADSDGGRRFPLALFGLIAVLAAAGIAIRTGSARAGILTTAVLLAMPLLALQSRMLTSDIGTACGSALLVYALVAFAYPNRKLLAVDLVLSSVALLAGLAIGFLGGGALLGVLVPIGAVAAAGSLGVPLVVDSIKGRPWLHHLPALIATVATVALVGVLAYQIYNLVDPYPGLTPPPARQVLGKAIVPEGCWSSALGGIWRPEDDTRYIFDSTFEQIAYGTFPWGILGPIAMFALLRADDARQRVIGGVTLAWAGGAWIATEVFQRKVGFTIWSGYPAVAIAIGVWIDSVVSRRARGDRDAMPPGAVLIGLFVALAVLDLGKDLQSFTEKLTSLLVGSDTVQYPKTAEIVAAVPYGSLVAIIGIVVNLGCVAGLMFWQPRGRGARLAKSIIVGVFLLHAVTSTAVLLVGLTPRLWVLLFGLIVALGFALAMGLWQHGESAGARSLRRASNIALACSIAATLVLAAFWPFVWQPRLAIHLSSKTLLETYNDVRDEEHPEPLVIMGDLGHAPKSYTDVTPELAQSREQVVKALKRPQRIFAIAPQAELCALHREMGELPYFVVDDRNLRSLLFSNRIDGEIDRNPLAELIQHKEPMVRFKPKGRVVWDNKIELIGWDMPTKLDRGESFEAVTYYKILAPVGGVWTMLLHFDGPSRLRDGDHKPIRDRCPTSSWMPGDFIIDRHVMKTSGGSYPPGRYDLWIGFFTGSAPNFRNMSVSAAPGDMRDTNDRVKITSIVLD